MRCWAVPVVGNLECIFSIVDAMDKPPSEQELAEALFKTIASVLDELYEAGVLLAEEHGMLIDSIWYVLDYGSHLPK